MKKAGLITGASSGIGKELAIIHASRGNNVILTARRLPELETLAEEIRIKYQVEAYVMAIDLTERDAPNKIYAFTEKEGLFVDYLFNNAGFGGHGKFVERQLEADKAMIDLNVGALTDLMHLYLPNMVKNKFGKVLNVASTAGFIAGPLQATYFATKAFVVSLTNATSFELRHSGVTVTALCPGPVKTEFDVVAGMGGSDMFAKGADAYSTALCGYKAMMKGKRTVISDLSLRFLLRIIKPFLPERIMLGIIEKKQTI